MDKFQLATNPTMNQEAGRKRRRHETKIDESINEHESSSSSKNANDSKKKKVVQPLKGLILAVSTLDVKDKKHSTVDSSYQTVRELCIELGAKVTAQVHKKVFAVICNQSAVTQLTQRVRKAIKKKHALLIDVEWIRKCKEKGTKIDHAEYLLIELAESIMEKRCASQERNESKGFDKCGEGLDDDDIILDSDAGWSEPIALDCCCVCHETDRGNCKWCVDCSVTTSKSSA